MAFTPCLIYLPGHFLSGYFIEPGPVPRPGFIPVGGAYRRKAGNDFLPINAWHSDKHQGCNDHKFQPALFLQIDGGV